MFSFSNAFSQGFWTQIEDFPGSARDDAVSFIIGNHAYVGTGMKTGWICIKDFYRFDFQDESWTEISELNNIERLHASSFSINNIGYVGLGLDQNINPLNDFYRYKPIINSWVEMPSLPGMGRFGSACFVVNNKAFLVCGRSSYSYLNEVWEYNPVLDLWTQKNDFPGKNMYVASSFGFDTKAVILCGSDSMSNPSAQVWEYNPENDSWTQKPDFPGGARTHAFAATYQNMGFIGGGQISDDSLAIDFWSYNSFTGIFEQLPSMPLLPSGGIRGASAFATSNTVYVVCGLDSGLNRVKSVYKYNMGTGMSTFSKQLLKIFPNPVKIGDSISIDSEFTENIMSIQMRNCLGQIVQLLSFQSQQNKIQIKVPNIDQGIYFIEILTLDGARVNQKLMITQ